MWLKFWICGWNFEHQAKSIYTGFWNLKPGFVYLFPDQDIFQGAPACWWRDSLCSRGLRLLWCARSSGPMDPHICGGRGHDFSASWNIPPLHLGYKSMAKFSILKCTFTMQWYRQQIHIHSVYMYFRQGTHTLGKLHCRLPHQQVLNKQ